MYILNIGGSIIYLRKTKNWHQKELTKQLTTSVSVISRYERNEMTPGIDTAKKIAAILDTSIEYLLGESQDADLFKNKKMLKRWHDIMKLPKQEKDCLITTIDHFLKASKLNSI